MVFQWYRRWILIFLSGFIAVSGFTEAAQNLTCYQCTRNTNTECAPNELLPCPSSSDRCVTHIMKDDATGFKIKRECGLGPCTFNDLMMTKGLGLDACDRSRKEYFCIFCCKENGCNKDSGSLLSPSTFLIAISLYCALRKYLGELQFY